MTVNIPELLAPAGGIPQLKAAVRYGADAVYLGMTRFGMRAHAGNFTEDELKFAVDYCHKRNVKVHVTLNIFPYDSDFEEMMSAAQAAYDIGADAFIVADPGVIATLRERIPQAQIHLSTQMNTMNTASAKFWFANGVRRIVLSRELSLDQIAKMRLELPKECELESFVHGAVCMSYSGRCSLSKFMTGRDANHGDCAQACRWSYKLLEEKRPGEYFEVEQTKDGVRIFSAADMNMLAHLDKLCMAGVSSIKIEGRMKNEYYVSTVVSAYRRALDAIRDGRFTDDVKRELCADLMKISHRPYDTGFYFGHPEHPGDMDTFTQTMELYGRVEEYRDGKARVRTKAKLIKGDRLELLTPQGVTAFEMGDMLLPDGSTASVCAAPDTLIEMAVPCACEEGDLIRGECRNHRNG